MRRRLLIFLFIPFLLLGGIVWLAGQEWTLQWIAQKVVQSGGGNIHIDGVSGTLLNSFGIEKIAFTSPEKDIEINDLKLEWNPWQLLHGQLEIDRVSAGSLDINMKLNRLLCRSRWHPPFLLKCLK